jgi:DNA mismatch repair protein MutS
LGICPATCCSFTPFANIITYLNITDDIAAGKSHFKAGVARAQDLMTMLANLKPGEFSLAAIDELFNGTSYAEGQAAAYCLIELMGTYQQTINVTATHFPRITGLEQQSPELFKNYMVTVTFDRNGTIIYPFKLEPGCAQQHIALDILEQEGFGAAFVKRARSLLKDENVH